MPYGIDKKYGGDTPENIKWMDECVDSVMKSGKEKPSAIAICKAQFKKMMESESAVWTTKYINDLPDSAFLYIEPGGKKDDEGKTVPRSLRHFPYKDKDGKVDLPHLRNAIARIPQSNLPEELKKSLQEKARKILQEANSELYIMEENYKNHYIKMLMNHGLTFKEAKELYFAHLSRINFNIK